MHTILSATACVQFESADGKSDNDVGAFAELRADRVGPREQHRAGTQRLAVTNPGTIADRGLYTVNIFEDGRRVGELDEEMVFESRPGEVFVLGASSWKIVDITPSQVLVVPAPGEPGKIAFWRSDLLAPPPRQATTSCGPTKATVLLDRFWRMTKMDSAGRSSSPARPETLRASRTQLEAAYEEFRSGHEGDLRSPRTLEYYDAMLMPFLDWVTVSGITTLAALDVRVMRAYRLHVATRAGKSGRRLSPHTVVDSHSAVLTFMRWAAADGYQIDPRLFDLPCPRMPEPEPYAFHMDQLRAILDACNPALPQEALAVGILVGSGLRASELCGLAVKAPDGLSDLVMDRLPDGAELRVRWNAGAKGRKSRRVPVTAGLAASIKRYLERHRPAVAHGELLINDRGEPYRRYGIDAMMDRLQRRVGFRVHAHAFRHTFATVATKFGWSLEHVRAAMGHADYGELHRYVKLATARDLGARSEWARFIVADPTLDWR